MPLTRATTTLLGKSEDDLLWLRPDRKTQVQPRNINADVTLASHTQTHERFTHLRRMKPGDSRDQELSADGGADTSPELSVIMEGMGMSKKLLPRMKHSELGRLRRTR